MHKLHRFVVFKDPVLFIMHCALQKSAAIFLMLKSPIRLIALCNPFASAMSVVKRLFMYLQYLLGNTYFNIAIKFKETRSTRRYNFFPRNCMLAARKAKARKTIEASLPCKQRCVKYNGQYWVFKK